MLISDPSFHCGRGSTLVAIAYDDNLWALQASSPDVAYVNSINRVVAEADVGVGFRRLGRADPPTWRASPG